MAQFAEAMNKYNKALEKSKATMDSVHKFQNDLMLALNQSLSNLDVFKQELVNIIINNEKSDDDKIKELRICILKFNPIEIKLTYPSSNGEIRKRLF